ncbi:hypothetical protein EZV62_025274 [Acer yangbiense]|uniref:DUF4283 domain-containing protein n=1 Tax=Acer yangbiense TaxID=1000413 RepID=A0A5C7GXZ7_9ROSI|nr:hypothetical protein EZV62_025274 [Acer yangbiense]
MDPEEIARLCVAISIKSKEEKLWVGARGAFITIYWSWKKLNGVGDIGKIGFNRVEFWVQIYNAPLMCMTKDMGVFLGKLIGDLVDIDVGFTGECFGEHVRDTNMAGSREEFCRKVGNFGLSDSTTIAESSSVGVDLDVERKKSVTECMDVVGGNLAQ